MSEVPESARMIRVFTGDDRNRIQAEVKKVLGTNYEVFEGENLSEQDLMNVLVGRSLFAETRKILIKDLTPARRDSGTEKVDAAKGDFDAYEEILKYVDTPHEIVIWETTTPLKKSYKDLIKNSKVKQEKFAKAKPVDTRKVFDIFEVAWLDGPRAVKMLSEIQDDNDPYMFFGLLASQAIKKYEFRAGAKEKRVLKELSKLDMLMKTTSYQPWLLLQAFLLQVSSL